MVSTVKVVVVVLNRFEALIAYVIMALKPYLIRRLRMTHSAEPY